MKTKPTGLNEDEWATLVMIEILDPIGEHGTWNWSIFQDNVRTYHDKFCPEQYTKDPTLFNLRGVDVK